MFKQLVLGLTAFLVAQSAQAFDFKNWVDVLKSSLPMECHFTRASHGVRIDTDDPQFPLEFVEDCYKFVRYFEKPVTNRKSGDLLYKEEKAEWRWKYTVKNKSDDTLRVYVKYKLVDKDDFVLAETSESDYVSPNDRADILGQIITDKDIAEKVSGGSWSINYKIINK